MLNRFGVYLSSDIAATPVENWRRLAIQEGCGKLDVTVDHDEGGHLERSACCDAAILTTPRAGNGRQI